MSILVSRYSTSQGGTSPESPTGIPREWTAKAFQSTVSWLPACRRGTVSARLDQDPQAVTLACLAKYLLFQQVRRRGRLPVMHPISELSLR